VFDGDDHAADETVRRIIGENVAANAEGATNTGAAVAGDTDADRLRPAMHRVTARAPR
jgi:hypothetical protein